MINCGGSWNEFVDSFPKEWWVEWMDLYKTREFIDWVSKRVFYYYKNSSNPPSLNESWKRAMDSWLAKNFAKQSKPPQPTSTVIKRSGGSEFKPSVVRQDPDEGLRRELTAGAVASGCKYCLGSGILEARTLEQHSNHVIFICHCRQGELAAMLPENAGKVRKWSDVDQDAWRVEC